MAAHARARDAVAALGFDLGDTRRWTADAGGAPPPAGEPDTLECHVFLPPGTPPAAAAAALSEWRAWCARVVPRFVWSSDALALRLVPPGSLRARRAGLAADDARPLLHGKLHYGDAQGDEWWATWLLCRLSRAHPGTVVHVCDADGDFLAIEAADALPRWFTPATGAHRTFFHGGRVHLVPLPAPAGGSGGGGGGGGGLAAVPSLAVGAAYVHAHPRHSLAPARVQRAVSARLATFPGAAAESVHVAACVLPVGAARVLQADPALVAPAVAAFYSRDPSDVQRAARMRAFPPHAGFVRMSVPLSRVLVAQLLMQRYHPPAAMGKAGGGGGDGASPAPPLLAAADLPRPGGPGHRQWDLGLKLSAGLEMLLWQQQGGGWRLLPPELLGAAAPPAAIPAAAAAGGAGGGGDDDFTRYLAALTRRGYFEGCRHPADKQRKTERARGYWASARASASGDALPPALGGGDGTPSSVAAADAAALEDAAEELVAPPVGVARPEAPTVRVARALLACTGAGASTASSAADAAAWPPACDVDDSLSWMDEGADEDGTHGDDGAALAAETRRLTALSQALLRQLGLDDEPTDDEEPELGAAAAAVDGARHDSVDGARGGHARRRPGADASGRDGGGHGGGEDAVDLDDDAEGGSSRGGEDDDDDDDDGDDDDDVDDDGSEPLAGPDDGDDEMRQLNELVSTLGGFFKGSSGLDGVVQPRPEAAAAAAPATAAAPFGAGLARSSLAGAFAARAATGRGDSPVGAVGGGGASRPAPPATAVAAAARAPPPLSVAALEALLAAHNEEALRDTPPAPCVGAAETGGDGSARAAWPESPFAAAAAARSSAVLPWWDPRHGSVVFEAGDGDDGGSDTDSWSDDEGRDVDDDEEEDEEDAARVSSEGTDDGAAHNSGEAARRRAGIGVGSTSGAARGSSSGGGGGASEQPREEEDDDDRDEEEEEPEPSMAEVMAAMDEALALEGSGSLGASFARVAGAAAAAAAAVEGGDDRGTGGGTAHPGGAARRARDSSLLHAAPLSDADVRFNLVTSLMQSVGGQAGVSGPASNLLGHLGLPVPRPWWQEGAREGPAAPSGGS